jgi:F-type H+-transporting ATPase subunit b
LNLRLIRLSLLLAVAVCALAGAAKTHASPLPSARNDLAPAILLAPPEGPAGEDKGETREIVYKTINFLILAGGLVYLLRKPLADFFTQRSAEIRAGLEEGRKALEASQARLSAVEEKLRRLEEEVAAFKAAAEHEMDAERQRLRQAAESEAQKILESARARMETAARAAQLDLKRYIADQALTQAEQLIRARMDDSTRQRLVRQFVEKLQ